MNIYSPIILLVFSCLWQKASSLIRKEDIIGNIAFTVSSPSIYEEWRIDPPVDLDKVTFIFRSLSITTAQMLIYETGRTTPVFSCVACGSTLPPVFVSSTGSVRVVIQGVDGASFETSSFDLQYMGHISSLSDATSTSDTDFIGELHMAYGHIQPPLIASKYLLANSKLQWKLVVGAPSIRFTIVFLNIKAGCDGMLTIYDGLTPNADIIFQGCTEDALPDYWLYSATGNASIVLEGGSVDTEFDFQIDYLADADLYHCGSLVTAPDILSANSFSIVDGSKSARTMRRSESCRWLIKPIDEGPVVLLMNWVSLKQGTKVVVYDSDGPDGVVLWNSEGTFAIVPPPLISSDNSLFVTYTSNTLLAGSFLGFRGDYFSAHRGSAGTGSEQELYSMSSAMGITLPDKVTRELYPNSQHYNLHRSNFNYSYLVKPMSAVGMLVLIFSGLSIMDCGDRLRIYDGDSASGPLLGEFCGNKLPYKWIHAPSGNALIEFSSDKDVYRNSSFELNYYTDGPNYHCGFPTNPATITAPSMRFTDGSHSDEAMYSKQYCEWLITPQEGENVFVYFDRLDIEGGGEVVVYDGTQNNADVLIRVTEGFAVPVPVQSSSSSIRVVFSSTSDVAVGYGFSLAYFSVSSIFTGPGDGVINLFSSTYNSLSLPTSRTNHKGVVSNYTWFIRPPQNEFLYVILSKILIKDCAETFRLYSGSDPSISGALLAEFNCSGQRVIPSNTTVQEGGDWIEFPGGEAIVEFMSSAVQPYAAPITTDSFFDLAYFSTGESYSCGLATNPGYLKGASMYFSDGSPPSDSMHLGETCEWIIHNEYATSPGGTIVLEFSQNDLRGGAEMWVFDGSNETANVLWHCYDCSELPFRLLSSTSSLMVRFTSPPKDMGDDPDVEIGAGFQASYWTITEEFWRDTSEPQLLLLPRDFQFSEEVIFLPNATSSWQLGLSESESTLSYFPSYSLESSSFDVSHNDGRSDAAKRRFQPPETPVYTCGYASGVSTSYLVTPSLSYASHQRSTSYLVAIDVMKSLWNVVGSWTGKEYAPENITSVSDPIVPSQTCQYTFDSGPSRQSISLKINTFNAQTTGRLRVIAGILGTDRVILDINREDAKKINLDIPCGKATIIIDANTTWNSSSPLVDYGFEMTYSLNRGDRGRDCNKYIKSLKKEKEDDNFYEKLIIPLAVLFVVGVCITSVLFVQNRLPKCLWIKRFKKRFKRKKYAGPAPTPYPKYTPKMDQFKNKMLLRGECMVCQISDQKVVKLKCKHKICLDDLRGYIVAALGDVSMFPLKCPLHFDNCVGKIDAGEAKRVLSETQYEKFCEFSDRSTYGDGMRCIFCSNFVNYPTNGSVAMVECPYCIQRFCIKCKKPWHYGERCSVSTFDDSLEAWTKQTGAQKCPTCSKIIEKEDATTCHHMVHKITDGIPCTRDRTDFCYLCGLEVTADYPHDEVKNPGINHFPEGVFQRCRTEMMKERDKDRERLRKAKRLKKQGTLRSRSNVASVAPMLDDDWDNNSIDSARSLPVMGSDPFDVAFGQALNARVVNNYIFDDDDDDM